MCSSLALLMFVGLQETVARDARFTEAPRLAARIDALTSEYWRQNGVKPANLADDSTFLRRITLDLTGRIPTGNEALAFASDAAPGKRARVLRRLMESPEFPLQLGRVLDDILQGNLANDAEFLGYLRRAMEERRPWDRVFREILNGPWDKEAKGAHRFLARRVGNLDDLTNDTARVFFGVNVSCAKCHDHPLVSDWKQDHYFGMASFFNPTYEGSKGKGRAALTDFMEKLTEQVMFVTTKGERRTARRMFLSNQVVEDPSGSPPTREQKPTATSAGGREQLVRIALEEKGFFSKAIVNQLWAYYLGQGLVHPVDQVHSANPPAIPDVLEFLADDLAANGYQLDRLIAALLSSQVYQLASTRNKASERPGERNFARAALRPLTPRQYAMSVVLAAGEAAYDPASAPEIRTQRYRDLESQSAQLLRLELLDPRTDRFQSSAGEALFMSNQPALQRWLEPKGKNLAARLAALPDSRKVVETAVWTILSRAPETEELAHLAGWLNSQKGDRGKVCAELTWALLTSAEFRFNH